MQNINIKDIKVVKLVNGDDVLCYLPTGAEQLPEKGPLLRLVKPLQIRYVPSFTEEGLRDYIALSKWAAYTTDKVVTIPKDKIMTITNASNEMITSYATIAQNYDKQPVPVKQENYRQQKFSDAENEKISEIFDDFDDDEGNTTIH